MSETLAARLRRARLVVLDVDGVLTDGTLQYGAAGEVTKTFHVRDGLGIRRLLDAGVEVAVVTGRGNEALARRMAELGVRHVYTGRDDKLAAVEVLLDQLGLSADELVAVGDDLPDLPVLAAAAVGVAVADAHPTVRQQAAWVTEAGGGRGAVRELADALLDARSQRTAEAGSFRVVIPARYASTRLPGKPLRLLAGRPMIAHVWERALLSGAAEVLVATDDERIRDAVVGFGGRAIMTSAECASGTDRLAEVCERQGWSDDEVVVNLQGDEPCMPSGLVAATAGALAANVRAGIATLATPVREPAELFDPNAVKVVVDEDGLAAYFSRAPIPWVRGAFDGGVPARLPEGVPFLRHLGLYAYRVGVVRRLAAEPVAPVERAESLEQLRALALGIRVHVTVVAHAPGHGVDTEADLVRAEQALTSARERSS